MADLALVQVLETRMLNAWPALDTMFLDSWVVRFANGYSRRANSATPLMPGATLDCERLDVIAALFERVDIAPVVRVTPLAHGDVDGFLAGLGYARAVPSLCLTAPIPPDAESDLATLLTPTLSPEWVRVNAESYGGEKANADHLAAIVGRIRVPAVFATVSDGGDDVAWGIGVTDRGYLALQDLVVRPDRRGAGVGRRLVGSLLAWGRETGAHTAYLQVREDNMNARRLYERFGFTLAYSYHHRVR